MADINRKVLNEVNKGATMGMDAISYVTDKVEDEKFKKILNVEYNKYRKTFDKVNEIYSEYGEGEPQEINPMNKMMTWYGIQVRITSEDSESKIAELFLKGTNMGIIEGRKLLNNKEIDKGTKDIIEEYVDFQEEYVEKLKEFL